MQLKADVLQQPLRCASTPEMSALGAAVLAGKEPGRWQYGSKLAALQDDALVVPEPANAEMMAHAIGAG